MRMMWVAVAAALTAATPAMAQDAACPQGTVAPPADLAGWSTPGAVNGAASGASARSIAPGRAVRAALLPVAQVDFAPVPDRVSGFGGVLAFDVAAAGRYRVALGAGAWIDLVRDGAVLTSVGHGHGPACSGIRKMVDFDLAPGRYLIQLSGAPEAAITAMVVEVAR
ncbi:homogentisate 1,2-dioxygenase [Sphingomonas sp.]|uniref:homogentisate 1,2-dioxygenase n=1 Tax=Sphingomonas sp. TaxID=28214 RepID=UPI002D0A59D9|nr:homogentisate 1,2-dioxygenase [Sphingomonas sp.]HWK36564.1 homogentisate 1,2-dioxygenase [Sphingomonas sp.]